MSDHWLLSAARKAGITDGESLVLSESASVVDAWRSIALRLGVSQPELADAVASVFRMQRAELAEAEPTAVKLLPASVARAHMIFPLHDNDSQLVVATADPTDADAEQAVGFASGRTPLTLIAPPAELEPAIETHYAPERAVESLISGLDAAASDVVELIGWEEAEREVVSFAQTASGPVVRLTNMILLDAILHAASDLHIQPVRSGGLVRFRVDGVLRAGIRMPLPAMDRVISRLKVLADMDIAVRLRPQDGKARLLVQGRRYDLRLSTVPTGGSEKAVIRILDPASTRTLEDTGIPEIEKELLRTLLRGRDGMILITGPTGSGKTTTIYGALREITTDDLNIMTVEDPVEYELPGLAQIQVEPKQGVTFASALRAILRQDPDVIFVGEIRDAETAEVAVQASLTGHLVLATLHTDDAVGVVRRLSDLGLPSSSIADTFRGAMAQRLVRRLCESCAEVVDGDPTDEERRLIRQFGVRPKRRAKGCERCHHSGYKGRCPVVELLAGTAEIRRLVEDGAVPAELEEVARASGMRTMFETGIALVEAGETTLEELERVVGVEVRQGGLDTDSEPEDSTEESVIVLVVDDDGVNRAITRALLEAQGYDVAEAVDGREAIDYLDEEREASLMILDLDMPRVGGREVLRHVRSRMRTAGLPVIVLTGAQDHRTEIELLEQGADDYIRKPVHPPSFITRVRAVLSRARG